MAFTAPIPDIYDNIERPLMYGVIKDLVLHGFLPTAKRIDFQPRNKSLTPGSTKNTSDSTGAYLKTDTVLTVEEDTEYVNEPAPWHQGLSRNRKPLYMDESLESFIYPTYEHLTTTLTFTYSTGSYNELRTWEQHVRTMVQFGKNRVDHDLVYSYMLHQHSYEWLRTIYDLREKNHGYGDSFSEYLHQTMGDGAVVVQSGNARQLAIAEEQVDIHGFIENEGKVTLTRGDTVHTGSLTWRIVYRRPTSLYHTVPVMVHQSVMPNKYLPDEIATKHYRGVYVESPIMRAYSVLNDNNIPKLGIRVPGFDRDPISSPPMYYTPIFTVLPVLEGGGPQILFNLTDLGDVCISDPIIKVLKELLYEQVAYPYRSPLHVSLHMGGHLLDPTYVTCDKDLNVRLSKPVDPRKIYRASFSVINNLSSVGYDWISDLVDYPDAWQDIVDTINSIDNNNNGAGGMNSNVQYCDLLDPVYLNAELDENPHSCRGGYGKIVTMRTVMNLSIHSYKKKKKRQ